MLKCEELSAVSRNKEEERIPFNILRERILGEFNHGYRNANVVSVVEHRYEYQVTPEMNDSSTWFWAHKLTLDIYYTIHDSEYPC